jgi:hypothetical protein
MEVKGCLWTFCIHDTARDGAETGGFEARCLGFQTSPRAAAVSDRE